MNPSTTICVTGASGYIASWIICYLLEEGFHVRGTVRGSRGRYPWLTSLEGADDRLELIQADLLDEQAFNEAVKGCDTIMHTASPYVINVDDPKRDIVDPAVKGTRSVLEACLHAPTVRRVILTSSVAAITDEPISTKTYSEEDWNRLSTLDRNPYHYSKTLAEQEAWALMEREQPGFNLITINPSLVIGPSLGPGLNTSPAMILDIINGVYPGIMDLNWGFVDVRDVARAHILAMKRPNAHGRYLCSAGALHMRDIVSLIRESGISTPKLPKLDLSSKAGTMLIKLLSYTQPKNTGTFIRTHIGRTVRYDNAKIRRELDLTFTPIAQSLLETVRQFQERGVIA